MKLFVILILHRPDYEDNAEKGNEDVQNIECQKRFFEKYSGGDDDPDGRARTDHVHVRHGHVLQPVEEDDEVAGPHHRPRHEDQPLASWKRIL